MTMADYYSSGDILLDKTKEAPTTVPTFVVIATLLAVTV